MPPQTIINALLAFVIFSPFSDGVVQSILHNNINVFAEMQVVCYKEWEKRKHALSLSLQAEMADGSVGLEGQRTIVLHSSRAELNRTTAKRSRKRISSSACYGAEKQEGSLFSIINLNITSKAGCKDSRHIMLNTSSFYRCQQLATMSYHFVHRY